MNLWINKQGQLVSRLEGGLTDYQVKWWGEYTGHKEDANSYFFVNKCHCENPMIDPRADVPKLGEYYKCGNCGMIR